MSNLVLIRAACRPGRENLTMKRSVVALGILGLVCGVVLPAASAGVLYKADFSASPFKGFNGKVYVQGFGGLQRSDPTVPAFFVRDGVLTSSPPDSTAGSDGVSGMQDPPGVRFLLLTGDPSWADVSITSKIRIDGQNTGGAALVARAAPKTKVTDPDSWYEFRYTTGNSPAPDDETANGIMPPETNPNVRIMKVVKGKWTMLAENTVTEESSIPAINAAGDFNESGAVFRFIVKGDLLQGFISTDEGKTFKKVLEAHDTDLKAGLIGISHYDYNPLFYSLLVEDAP
jgi:hypothetical protein